MTSNSEYEMLLFLPTYDEVMNSIRTYIISLFGKKSLSGHSLSIILYSFKYFMVF